MKIKIPKELKPRLEEVGKKHDLGTAEATAEHFVTRGLAAYGADKSAKLDKQMAHVVDDQGYSSKDELLEHLLLRGLRAYEESTDDPKKLEERLRGLGYID